MNFVETKPDVGVLIQFPFVEYCSAANISVCTSTTPSYQ